MSQNENLIGDQVLNRTLVIIALVQLIILYLNLGEGIFSNFDTYII